MEQENLFGIIQEVIIPPEPEEIRECLGCKKYLPISEMLPNPIEVQDKDYTDTYYCEDCLAEKFIKCDDCGDWELKEDSHDINSDRDVCDSCWDDYFTCIACDYTYSNDRYGSDGYCDDCEPDEEENEDGDSNVINAHGFDALRALSKMGSPADNLYFGIELEVEAGSGHRLEYARKVASATEGFAIIKSDGSLANGFEIVTAPASFKLHYKKWNKFFQKVKEWKAEYEISSYDNSTCGMHIHFSREAVTEIHLAKIMCFLHNPVNQKFVETIAGRSAGRWCKYTPKAYNEAQAEVKSLSRDRYQALNITPKSTAEVRIFKGTLKKSSFFKNLEFVHALIHFTKPATRTLDNSISYVKFIEWLSEQPNAGMDYKNLLQFLLEKKLIVKKGEELQCVSLLKKNRVMLSRKRNLKRPLPEIPTVGA